MDIEIDDRRAGDAVTMLCVTRRDRGVVEQTEAHRPRGLGMVAGRPRGDEGIGGPFCQNLVDGVNGTADRAYRRFETTGRHRGIGVEPHHALSGRRVADLGDVVHGMAQCDDLKRRRGRQHAGERLELFRLERALDGA